MHVLVTGGAGFIGSHLVDAYLARGWKVAVLDDLSTGVRENVPDAVELRVGDLGDPANAAWIAERKFDLINHQAAQVDVRKSVADPAGDAETNVVGSIGLFEAAARAGVKRILFASSGGAAYGEPLQVPQSEEHPVQPLSPYGCAKASVELYLNYFRAVHGIETAILRYANVYGPRQRTDGEAGVVAIFAGKILRGEPAVINGDGQQTRDYVYVSDVVAANLAVSDKRLSGAFNVGTGVETTVNALFKELVAAAGKPTEVRHGPAKEGEQLRSVLDGSKLRRLAGLPEPVSLREGLKRTLQSMK